MIYMIVVVGMVGALAVGFGMGAEWERRRAERVEDLRAAVADVRRRAFYDQERR